MLQSNDAPDTLQSTPAPRASPLSYPSLYAGGATPIRDVGSFTPFARRAHQSGHGNWFPPHAPSALDAQSSASSLPSTALSAPSAPAPPTFSFFTQQRQTPQLGRSYWLPWQRSDSSGAFERISTSGPHFYSLPCAHTGRATSASDLCAGCASSAATDNQGYAPQLEHCIRPAQQARGALSATQDNPAPDTVSLWMPPSYIAWTPGIDASPFTNEGHSSHLGLPLTSNHPTDSGVVSNYNNIFQQCYDRGSIQLTNASFDSSRRFGHITSSNQQHVYRDTSKGISLLHKCIHNLFLMLNGAVYAHQFNDGYETFQETSGESQALNQLSNQTQKPTKSYTCKCGKVCSSSDGLKGYKFEITAFFRLMGRV
jgi:hypothetical protein